jgi:hypothetical protein
LTEEVFKTRNPELKTAKLEKRLIGNKINFFSFGKLSFSFLPKWAFVTNYIDLDNYRHFIKNRIFYIPKNIWQINLPAGLFSIIGIIAEKMIIFETTAF